VCLTGWNDAEDRPARSVYDCEQDTLDLAECHEPELPIIAPPVFPLEHRAIEDSYHAREVDPVLAEVGLALGWVPLEGCRIVYTMCIHVKVRSDTAPAGAGAVA